MNNVRTFTAADFCIDMTEEVFHGFSDGDTWNGFACPYFEYSEAVRVLQTLGNQWEYVKEDKAFIVRNLADPDDLEPEEFEVISIVVDGRTIEVYAIGAYSWIWDYCKD